MAADDALAGPNVTVAMLRGFRERCPHCGQDRLFRAYLKLADRCRHCGASCSAIRADDLPAYLTVLVVGHLVVPALLWAERYDFPIAAELAVAVPLALVLIGVLLPRFKGAAAGLLWSLARQKNPTG